MEFSETSPAAPLLIARGASKRYGEGEGSVLALDHANLELYGGRIYGLLGANGAGKTTFIRICATLLAPTAGDVWIASHHTVKDAREVRANLGYLSSATGTYDRMTPEEILVYFGRLHDMPRKLLRDRMDLLFAVLGISDYRDRITGKLSTGMRQKVSIARAFLHDPAVVILDEPTNGLDVLVRKSLLELLRDFSGPERLIILSTHDLTEAETLCDSFIFIDRGRIISQSDKAEIVALPGSLQAAFYRALEDSKTGAFLAL